MALSEMDQHLLERCLARTSHAWEDFVDRFLGLVVHVINHTAQSRSIRLADQDREDLAADVFLAIVDQDLAVLRKFRRESSLATYLTVIARRVVVRELLKRNLATATLQMTDASDDKTDLTSNEAESEVSGRDEIDRLLGRLSGPEAQVVRLYHLDGHSYQEISQRTGIPANSIGPTLTRARSKMRRLAKSKVEQPG